MNIAVYILAGGKSDRFGGDKTRYVWRGRPLILHALDQYREFAESATLVTNSTDRFADLDLRAVLDRQSGLGPLGGLHAALLDARERGLSRILLSSGDRFGLDPAWLQTLIAQDVSKPAAYRAQFWEPMPGIYPVSLIELIEAQMQSGTRALWRVLDAADAHVLPRPRDWDRKVVDVNRPRDLARLEHAGETPLLPPTVQIVGRKNSGKTTLMVELIEEFCRRGLKVGSIKHSGHVHDVDVVGKDSHRHRAAGANPGAFVHQGGIAVFASTDAADDPYAWLAPLYAGLDLILIEGDRERDGLQIEVWRAATGKSLLAPESPNIKAIVSDDVPPTQLPVWPRGDIAALADRIRGLLDID